jgi:hypothetical protein
MTNDERNLIHSLLYHSLVEIRSAAYENKSYTAIFKIADIFHNIPLQLEKASRGERKYQDILDDIAQRAKRNECLEWLEDHIREHQNRSNLYL